MLGIFAIIGVVVLVVRAIKEIATPELPASYHGNSKLEAQDAQKVILGEMSRSQFNRNIRSGKYSAPTSGTDHVETIKERQEREWEEWKAARPWGRWN